MWVIFFVFKGDSVVVHSSSYSEGECYDYDADVDDLFSLAAKIMNCSDSDVVSLFYSNNIICLLFTS